MCISLLFVAENTDFYEPYSEQLMQRNAKRLYAKVYFQRQPDRINGEKILENKAELDSMSKCTKIFFLLNKNIFEIHDKKKWSTNSLNFQKIS